MLKIVITLREVMKQRGLTQKQLEELSGVPQSKISHLSNNSRTEIKLELIEKIAHALNIKDLSELMRFEEVDED